MTEIQDQSANSDTDNGAFSWPDSGIDAAVALLKPDRLEELVVVDVGAHVGESLYAIKTRVAGKLRYIGLEPNPLAYEKLSQLTGKLTGRNCSVTVLNAAAGSDDGRAKFQVTRASAVCGILKPVDGLSARVPSGDHEITKELDVELTTIETLARTYSLGRIDFLKVDAEGYDLHVLRGARALLTSGRIYSVMAEVFFVPYRTGQAYFWDIAKFMEDVGYHFVNFYDSRNTSQGRLYTGNALWVSPDIAERNGFL